MIQKRNDSITVPQVIKEMGLEPTQELVSWVEAKMQEYQTRHPSPKDDGSDRQKMVGFVTVEEVIRDMGLEPTPELVVAVDKAMVDWFEHEFREVTPVDDGGRSCYYSYNGSHYYLEENFRKKIEGFARVCSQA